MSSSGKEVLLKVFPAEIWEHILEHVKEPQDYHNLCSASQFFRDLLLPRAPEILFQEVAKPILYQVQREILKERNDSKALLRRYAVPFRQVFRSWRQGVDQILQTQHFNPSFPRGHEEFSSKIYKPCARRNFDRFLNSEAFSEFNRQFRSTHVEARANPFVSRAVLFSWILQEENNDMWLYDEFISDNSDAEQELEIEEDLDMSGDYFDVCSQFLGIYGRHIWTSVIQIHVNVDAENEKKSMFKLYDWLRTILERMPNLQHLVVEIDGFWETPLRWMNEMDDPSLDDPFPTLPELRFLSVTGYSDIWVWELLKANPQVEMVDARGGTCWSADTIEHLLEYATNLKGVAFWLNDGETELDTFCETDVNAPVENLWLGAGSCKCDCRSQPKAWQRIFTSIKSHFSSSLKHLCIGLPKLPKLEFDEGLVLPQLKILELNFEELVPLDFLLPLKDTLEQLSVRTWRSTEQLEGSVGTLQLHDDFWDKPEMSNAWVLFPKLKLLRTGKGKESWYSCSRDQWRNAQAT